MNAEEELEKVLVQYRKDKFDVNIEKAKGQMYGTTFDVSITHNGSQWQSINLTKHEIEIVVYRLNELLDSLQHEEATPNQVSS